MIVSSPGPNPGPTQDQPGVRGGGHATLGSRHHQVIEELRDPK